MTVRNFVCNRIVEAFLRDKTSTVKLLFGCVGSGKSSACCIDMYLTAQNMPAGRDGKKRSKFGVIRNTYSQLETTTVRTWKEWFPPDFFGAPKGKSPITHLIKIDNVEMEVLFLSLDNEDDLEKIKSLEVTAIYVNEAQFIYNPAIILNLIERTNRFPSENIFGGALGRPLVIMDCNPPSTTHWIYQKFERERINGWSIYKMPPALVKDSDQNWINNPEADFISQASDQNYWLKLAAAAGNNEEYIRVSLCGEYGVVEDGRAVHAEYNDRLHYVNRIIQPNDQVEIGLGWDFGNTPACAVVQMMPDGQLVILDEFWTEYMSVREFAQNEVIPQLDKKYPFWRKNYKSLHDPSGQGMNSDGRTCQQILQELGIISIPAASNSSQYRRDGLKYFLTKMVAGQPAILLSSNCSMLREGLMGKFKYEVIKASLMQATKAFQEKPLKNIFSHICEALEYICTEYASNVKTNYSQQKEEDILLPFKNKFTRLNKLRSEAWQR